ncbi:hypothetical protein SMACR_06654 [Sordaria macrospora]|uniref:WGS project CABT00000000 data, contig 2.13 n=2 Tax=Sordaria macrospora TaxID=5147 RepID=F7VY85_SORMK|nr:uncharacterized protein SMAC_06654 [Sordaria macrospora k-hell]KAA8632587.1 hypothetical protein SMACR_06654 [Sordaria macrospora]CCC10479.1 unnamed protein product [Sordaria macrospora k-hell]
MAPPAEISIPTTSISTPSSSSESGGTKPFTLYNITLRLPLRSFVVQKRYSDFLALHQALTSLVGSPPPEPLPAKNWFKSTVNSPELTEKRRVGLERYLRAIAEPPDRRWRDTPVWRAFLNLPGGAGGNAAASTTGSGSGIEGKIPAIGLKDANLAAASDPGTWLDLHRELKGALHEARVALGRRDGATENMTKLEAGSAAKRALVRAGSLLGALQEGLGLRRRRDLLAAARVERDGLDKLSSSLAHASREAARQASISGPSAGGGSGSSSGEAGERAKLFAAGSSAAGGGSVRGGRVLGAPLPETERTRELDNDGVLQLQRDTMRDQDMEVEALARIVRRQKEMGLAINDEVERQTNMLDNLNTNVDVVDKKLRVAKGRVKKLGFEEEEEDEQDEAADEDSLNRMIFVMSSEESSVAEIVVVPTTVVVQGDQQQQGEAVHRPRQNGRIRLRRDQWLLYESLPDDNNNDDGADDGDDNDEDHFSSSNNKKNEKKTRTKTESQKQQEHVAAAEGKERKEERQGEKGTPSGVGGSSSSSSSEEGNNILDAVLLLCVKGVLAGVQGFWLLQWVLGRLSDVLTKVVEFGLLLLGIQPTTTTVPAVGTE